MALGAEHQRTRRLQKRMFKNYLAFCAAHSITDLGASSAILAFIYSFKDTTSPRTVCNYMSALKAMMQRLGFNVHQFDGVIMRKFRKALSKAPVTRILPKCTFTIAQIETLFKVNKALGDHYPYATAFAMGLFAFLRISNLVPPSVAAFDPNKQLVCSDVKFTPQGATLIIKWAKNLQRSDQYHEVRVPSLGARQDSCPTTLLMNLLRREPGIAGSPLIRWKGVTLTESHIRTRLKRVLRVMDLQDSELMFHTCRRTGVSLAFGLSVPMDNIKAHGAWGSDAVWQYVKHEDRAALVVPGALASLFA